MTTEEALSTTLAVPPPMLNWSDDSGSDRDLVRAVLSQRLDEVRVSSLSRERIERCHKLGFPSSGAEPLLLLQIPQQTRHSGGPDSAMAPAEVEFSHASDQKGSTETSATPTEADIRELLRLCAEHRDIHLPLPRVSLLPSLLDLGYAQTGVLWTAHLMPMLSKSVLPIFNSEFSVSEEDVRAYGEQSGDLNPLHFDDDFARAHGFEQRISHGMLFNGWLTRMLGMHYPGPGTIFLRNSASFFAPVYADRSYRVRISTPRYDETKGIYLIVAQLLDTDGRHCTVSHNEVMLKPAKA